MHDVILLTRRKIITYLEKWTRHDRILQHCQALFQVVILYFPVFYGEGEKIEEKMENTKTIL